MLPSNISLPNIICCAQPVEVNTKGTAYCRSTWERASICSYIEMLSVEYPARTVPFSRYPELSLVQLKYTGLPPKRGLFTKTLCSYPGIRDCSDTHKNDTWARVRSSHGGGIRQGVAGCDTGRRIVADADSWWARLSSGRPQK